MNVRLVAHFAALLLLAHVAYGGIPKGAARPEVPRLEGEWWRLAAPPVLERFHKPGVQTVDFTIFRAGDGTWQLISCIRGTAHPGGGRLLYRWEAAKLTDRDWTPKGIFWTANPALGQSEGTIQAPHCVKVDGKYYLFYNSNGAYCLISEDGKSFRHHRTAAGELRFFDMPRDVMIFDDRQRDGLWYAFFTDIRPGQYADRKNHTIGARTALSLEGPWSQEKLDIKVVSPTPNDAYTFVYAESPFVLFRSGFYYRFEQMNVLASASPVEWKDGVLASLTQYPRAYLAPEIVEDGGRYYVAGYRDFGRSGIFMAPLQWASSGGPTSQATGEAAEKSRLVGLWKGFTVEGKGENPDRGPVKMEITITEKTMHGIQIQDDKRIDHGEGEFTLDRSADPFQLDAAQSLQGGRKRAYIGIYRLDGDVLKWCVSPQKVRPTTFETKKGQFLLILKRERK